MADQNPHRREIRAILLGSPSHYANTLRDMESGLTVEASPEKREVRAGRIVYLRETIRITLDGELANNRDIRRAKNQAGVYQDLLNYSMSPELRQHVDTRFAQLQQIEPSIKKEPLKYNKLGANERKRPETPQEPCKDCGLVHRGECW
jgi:hypothetical protein